MSLALLHCKLTDTVSPRVLWLTLTALIVPHFRSRLRDTGHCTAAAGYDSAAYSRVWVAAVLYRGLLSLLFRCWKLLMR